MQRTGVPPQPIHSTHPPRALRLRRRRRRRRRHDRPATDLQLVELLDLSLAEVREIRLTVCQVVAPQACSALDLWKRHNRSSSFSLLPTGLPALDHALHGGIPAGGITELVGASGLWGGCVG